MITKVCLTCGKEFQVKPYRIHKAKFCSLDCRDKAYIGQSPHYIPPMNRVTLTCLHCGKQFVRHASRLKWGRGKHCSPECQYAAIKARPKLTQIALTCINCHQTFYRYKSWINRKGGGKYCSRKCRDEHWKGEHNPLYINGNGVNWHGPNWQSQRRKALKRDNHTCQHCGCNQDDSIIKFGQPVVVHHIRPFRLFDDYKKANHLSNLTTLCHVCHREIENATQRLDRIANQSP